MFACFRIRKKMLPYLDGCLEAEEKNNVETHLHGCENCQEHLRNLEETFEFLKGQESARRSPEFWSGFESGLRRTLGAAENVRVVPEKKVLWNMRPIPAGAAALLLVAAVVFTILVDRFFMGKNFREESYRAQVPSHVSYETDRRVTPGIAFTTLDLIEASPEFKYLVAFKKDGDISRGGVIIFTPGNIIGSENNLEGLFFKGEEEKGRLEL